MRARDGGFLSRALFLRKRAEGGVAEGGVAEGGVAEGDAADRGAAKGLRGAIALRTAGTRVRKAQNPGRSRIHQDTVSGGPGGKIAESSREMSRCPRFCVFRASVPALCKAVPPTRFATPCPLRVPFYRSPFNFFAPLPNRFRLKNGTFAAAASSLPSFW